MTELALELSPEEQRWWHQSSGILPADVWEVEISHKDEVWKFLLMA